MREIRPSGSEGGVALITPSLPLSGAVSGCAPRKNLSVLRAQTSILKLYPLPMKHFVWSFRVRSTRVVLSMVCLGLLPVAGSAGDSPKNEPLLSSILGAAGPAGFCVHLGCGEGR